MIERQKNLLFLLIIFLYIVWSAPTTYASPRLNTLIEPQDNLSRLLPTRQTLSGRIVIPYMNQDVPFNSWMKVNPETGRVDLEFVSPLYEIRTTLDSALRIVESASIILEDRLIKKLGYDQRVTKINTKEKDSIHIEHFLKGRKVKEKDVDYDYFTFDLDLPQIALQALLLKGIKEFNTDVILKDRGWRININFQLVESKDLASLASEYEFPPQLKELLKPESGYYVYVGKISSILRILYKHKFYCVFSKTEPHKFVASWGGEPEWVRYVFGQDKVD
ncbi:MAG: hypothetical protein V3V52_07850 [Candidatus Adiutricales bacterium]